MDVINGHTLAAFEQINIAAKIDFAWFLNLTKDTLLTVNLCN